MLGIRAAKGHFGLKKKHSMVFLVARATLSPALIPVFLKTPRSRANY